MNRRAFAIMGLSLWAPVVEVSLGEESGRGEFRLFAPAFSGIGTNALEDVARVFSGGIFGGFDPNRVHRANPAAKAYRYQLGPYVQIKRVPKRLIPPSHPFYSEAGTAKDLVAESALVLQGTDGPQPGMANWPKQFPPYPIVVPDDPAWLAFLDAELPKLLDNYDGLFLDSMGTTPVVTRYLVARPINPKTRKAYSVQEWLAAEGVMVGRVRQMLKPGQVLFMQGLVNGETYFGAESPSPLLDNCDGGMAETVYRGPTTAADQFPLPERWLEDVRMIVDVDARGKAGFYWTKNWLPQDEAQRARWLRYALCSHLLGAGVRSHFNYDSHNEPVPKGRGANADAAEYHAEYDRAIRLGKAAAAMGPVGETGIYRRRWEHGWVYVNPTAESAEIELRGTFEDFDGRNVGGKITIPAHGGQIFLERQ